MAQALAVLTDGTTSASFADGAGGSTWYKVESDWAPRVASIRRTTLGGLSPYDDVTESLPISVGGSNAAHMYANISALRTLIDRADLWKSGTPSASAVLLKYSPTNATVSTAASPLQAPIWDARLDLPAAFNLSASGAWMSGATLEFTRTGAWHHISASASAAGSLGNAAYVVLASTAYLSPTRIQATNFRSYYYPTGTYSMSDAYVLGTGMNASAASFGLGSIPAYALASGAYTAPSAASVNYSAAGSVLRYTSSSTTKTYSASGALLTNCPQSVWAIYMNAYTTSSITYLTGVRVTGDIGIYDGPEVAVASSAYPRWYFMGLFPWSGSVAVTLFSTASASTAGTLDIDRIVVHNVTDPGAISLCIKSASAPFNAIDYTLDIDPRATTFPIPLVSASGATYGNKLLTAFGNNYNATSAASTNIVMLVSSGSGASFMWNAPVNNTWTLTRTTAYITPV